MLKGAKDDFKSFAKDDSGLEQSDASLKLAEGDISSLKKLHELQDSFDLSDTSLEHYTEEECKAEMDRCEEMNKHFRRLMYVIAVNTGWHNFTENFNFYLISEEMKRSSKDFTGFNTFTGFAWSLKPLYGWISDSFYPFKHKFKPYVTIMSSLYILLSIYVAIHTFDFQQESSSFNLGIFKVVFFSMNVVVGF